MLAEPTVFIVDDDEAVAHALRYLIESVGLRVEVFTSPAAFIEKCDPAQPGCLVLDVRMPAMSGFELLDWLRQHEIEIPVIFLTGHGDVPMAVRAMKKGAIDFIEKPFRDQELLDQIYTAIRVDAQNRRDRAKLAVIRERYESLTEREREVMDLVVAGCANKVIAERLGLSAKTVEVHRAKVMEKMKARSLSQLVQMAYELKHR
jgi:two-component system response regulator FixJ